MDVGKSCRATPFLALLEILLFIKTSHCTESTPSHPPARQAAGAILGEKVSGRERSGMSEYCQKCGDKISEDDSRLCANCQKKSELPAPKGSVERDGNWMDKWGACKVCDGEIPHGHTDNCDIFKLECEVARLRDALERIRDYPVHSEPVGGVMDIQGIALKALNAPNT